MTSLSKEFALLAAGILKYKLTGKTPPKAYQAMRRLHPYTGGSSTNWAANRVAKPWLGAPSNEGILEGLTADERSDLLSSLRQDGCAIAPRLLSSDRVAALRQFALSTPTRYLASPEVGGWSTDERRFEPDAPISNRYQFRLEQLIQSEAAMDLACDDSVYGLAGDYMDCDPVLDLALMWWTAPGPEALHSAAAQMYHFDLDRLRFLKLFVYLTDVTPESGPHCFVRGSHQKLPPTIRRDGRYSDQEVEAAFGEDAAAEICGPKGTILLADTRGFHKGKPCTVDHRLIFQLEYSCSLFGAPVGGVPIGTLPPTYAARVRQNPRRFSGVFAG